MSPLVDDPENLFATPRGTLKSSPGSDAELAEYAVLFGRWERYRLDFNAILAAETLLLMLLPRIGSEVMISILVLAIFANGDFCTGMVFNGYAMRLGYRGDGVSRVLFEAVTLLAMIVIWVSLFGLSIGLPVH